MAPDLLPLEIPEGSWRRRRCTVCGGNLVASYGSTYVAQRQGWVKIGQSKHVATRLRELAAHNRQRYIICPPAMDRSEPLILLFVIEADLEHRLHARWSANHAGGEWFLPDAAMRQWLEPALVEIPW